MIYTLHLGTEMYEVIKTDIPQDELFPIWQSFTRDENATDLQKWCDKRDIKITVLDTGTIMIPHDE